MPEPPVTTTRGLTGRSDSPSVRATLEGVVVDVILNTM